MFLFGTSLYHSWNREVGAKEAERCVLKYPNCAFEECSAAAQDDNVEVVFRSYIKQVSSDGPFLCMVLGKELSRFQDRSWSCLPFV